MNPFINKRIVDGPHLRSNPQNTILFSTVTSLSLSSPHNILGDHPYKNQNDDQAQHEQAQISLYSIMPSESTWPSMDFTHYFFPTTRSKCVPAPLTTENRAVFVDRADPEALQTDFKQKQQYHKLGLLQSRPSFAICNDHAFAKTLERFRR
ncbi:hypothetical protein BDZ94DRAFT_1259031 [Collybia nuda]|uniref:Uncharacterized protein n=1 Tax=Collybia nuda TaxID=64659 RepID=A0A9P6CJX7_9AGAR|nr:hypothetical protein BDZ94DRAFT_1259031 [Collybia nuda]